MQDRYERDAEAFVIALYRELYLADAGHKDQLEIAPLYDRYAWLFTRESVKSLLDARGDALAAHLAEFAVESHLDNAVKALTEEITNTTLKATVEWDGQPISYRSATIVMANEPDVARRHDLFRRILARTVEFHPRPRERLTTLYQGARDLGFRDYMTLWDEVSRLDLAGLAAHMRRLLDRTAAGYYPRLEHHLAQVGVPRAEANTADTARIFRATQFDAFFPAEKLVPALRQTLAGMGIDLDRQANLHLDIESRPLKSPRAFCAPIRVPDEVVLVISPHGGQDDYNTILHEAGHAEHFANTSADLPFAARYLGDNSVTEAYAMVFDNLTRSPRWLADILGWTDAGEYLRHSHFHKTFMLRRYGAKLDYEMQLHRGNLGGMDQVYARTLGESLGIAVAPENYLTDLDLSFYAARYLRAWIFEVQLRRVLEERFGEAWFASREAGEFLLGLWSQGQGRRADDLARDLGYDGLDPEPLIQELESVPA